jgi:hypothetical protein
MTTLRRTLRRLYAPCLLVLTVGCSDGRPAGGVTEPPVPGVLLVTLTTPHADDRAILLEVTGPTITDPQGAAPTGVAVHTRMNNGALRAAAFGAIGGGTLLRFTVTDVNAASRNTARVIEASGPANTLRESLETYQVVITRQP